MKNHTAVTMSLAAATLFVLAGTTFGQDASKKEPTPAKAEPAAEPANKPTPALATDVPFTVEVVASGLRVPWDIAFAPDGRMFVTERPGRVRVIVDGKLLDQPALTLDNIWKQPAENGLMSVCLHPDFAKNHFVYLSYGQTSPEKDIRVVRYTESANTLSEPKLIVSGIPAGSNHAGCRVRFGPDGKLYITAGESFKGELAQDLTSLGGKILRLDDDGTIPADNPFRTEEGKEKGWRAEIWTYGNRNPQGLCWNDKGELVEAEHGPSGEAGSGGDEINIIEKGKNYGWKEIHHDMTRDGMVSPIRQFTPAIAPTAITFYNADAFPAWKGTYFIAALGGLRKDPESGLYHLEIKDQKVVKEERFLSDIGRVRFVTTGPDGFLYVTTSNRDGRLIGRKVAETDDQILRLVPKKK
jgi:glucose/arabinose dehydrogenase